METKLLCLQKIIKKEVFEMSHYNFSKITPAIEQLAEKCVSGYDINPELYVKYDVKRGLRDLNGKGVLAGLTDISEVWGKLKR